MALSDSIRERIKRNTENKKNGIQEDESSEKSSTTQGSYESSSESSLSSSTLDRIAFTVALKKLGYTDVYEDYYDAVSSVDDNYINQFFTDWSKYSNRVQSAYDGMNWQSAQTWGLDKSYDSTAKDLMARSEVIRAFINSRKDYLDEESYNNLISNLDSIQQAKGQFDTAFTDIKKYYSQWETEDDYNQYLSQQKAYEELVNFDLEAGLKEIEELETLKKEYNSWKYLTGPEVQAKYREFGATYGDIKDLEALISEKTAYLNQAKRTQEGIALAGAVNNADFNQYSNYDSTESDNWWSGLTSQYGLGYDDLVYEYINGSQNGMRSEIINKAVAFGADNSLDATDKWKIYDQMTDEEISIYNYYYAKEGKESAEQYLESIQETLNYREGASMYTNMEDNTLLELAFGVAAGLDQFESGMEGAWSAVTGQDDYIPTSSVQYASGMVREDLADAGPKLPGWMGGSSLGQVGYDAITTTSNMAPSILASVAIGTISKTAGAYVGRGLMGTSAAGNAYQEKLNMGYTQEQARTYGVMVGASEVLLERLLGGVSQMGTGMLPDAVIKNLNAMDNVFAKVAASAGGQLLVRSGSEALEEGLQEILEPYLWQAVSGEEATVEWEQALYSSLLGFVTGGVFEGGNMAVNTAVTNANYAATGEAIMGNEGGVDALMNLANEVAGVSDSKVQANITKQSDKVGKNATARNVGRLYDTVESANNTANASANQADIVKSLERKGFSSDTAKDIAEALVASYNGKDLTSAQQKLLKSASKNSAVQAAISDIMANPVSTMGQRSQNIRNFQENYISNTSRTNPAQQSQANATTFSKVDAQNINGAESHYEVSADGKTIDSSGNIVSIKGVSAIENGRMVLETEDGGTINASDVTYGNRSEALVYEAVANLEGIIDTDTANKLSKHLMKLGGASSDVYVNGIVQAYTYGYYGYGRAAMTGKDTLSRTLTEKQRNVAYGLGEQYRDAKTKADEENARKVVAKNATTSKNSADPDGTEYKKVRFEGEIKKWTEKQKAEVEFIDFIASNFSGNTVHVYESYKGEDGKYYYKDSSGKVHVAPNGTYIGSTGDIYLDLNAGTHGEGLILNTFAHELYHHIQKRSPAKARKLAEFLVKELGYKSVEEAVNRQIAKAERGGYGVDFFMKEKGMSRSAAERLVYDRAFSDFVADSLETMFTEGDAVTKLQKLKAQDNTLFNWIKGFIDKWVTKLRDFYSNHSTISIEGSKVATLEKFEQIQQMFMEALVDAGENYQAEGSFVNDESLIPGEEGTVFNENGDPVAHATADGTVQLSLRTYDEAGRKAFRDYLNKCVKNKKLTKTEMQEMLNGIEEIYTICKDFKDKYAPFSSWSDAAVVRDTYGKPVFSVVTPNGDYKMNLDFSLVCKKRRTLDAVFNEMSKRGIIDNFELGQKSVVKINEIIRRYGMETACALCFVDAKRFRQASMADQFTNLYNELVLSLVPEDQRSSIDHFNFSGYETIKKVEGGIDTWANSKLDFSHLDHVLKTYGDGTVEYKAAKYIKTHAEGRKLLLRGDFMSSKGFDAVKSQNPDVLKLYNSKKGTGGPKAAFGDVQYMNEVIQKARWWTPKKAYEVGGVRIQSFSDYVPRMVFDYVQMIYDLAATKLPAHAYTKEALFVKQFGLTGVKINMSLIPAIAEGGIAPGLDANGNYVWAGESFDFETAKQIQNAEGYTENCGTICVGVSDRHIRKLLSDPDIRMVIPYHKSGLNPIVAHMNKIAEFTDYTNKQNTTVKETGSKAEEHFDFNKALHDMGKNADPRAVIQQYFDWCDERGYNPKFAEFRDHPNYYKLIEDFTLFDKDGKYVPQREVRAVFPKEGSAFGSMKDLIQEGLEEDAIVEGKRDSSLSAIVDEIEQTIPKTEAEIPEEQVAQADRDLEADVMLSDRDYVRYDSTAILKESKVDEYLMDYAAKHSPKYAQAHIAYMRPATFLKLTTDDWMERDHISEQAGDLDEEKLTASRPGIYLRIDPETGKVIGHEGRHRMSAMEKAGIYQVPVLLVDTSTNMTKTDLDEIVLRGQFNRFEIGIARDAIPLNFENRDRVIKNFATQSSMQRVGERIGHNKTLRFSDRDSESVSNRSLLANAFEGVAQNEIELNKIQEYKSKISLIEAEERKLSELTQKIRDLSFAKGPRDAKTIRGLQFEANQTANRISTYDKQLLRLEASKPLQDVLAREKKLAYQKAEKKGKEALEAYREKAAKTQRELMDRWQESRKKGIESREKTAMRHKIKDVVNELNQYLLKGTKDRHVPIELQKAVAEALDAVNMDTVGAEERIAKLQDELMKARTPEKIQEISRQIDHIREMGDRMNGRLKKLKVAYDEIINSDDPLIANSHDDGISAHMMTIIVRVGDTPLRDMTIDQLQDVYDVYRMVLTTIRNANKAFKAAKSESISVIANRVMEEVVKTGGKKQFSRKGTEGIKSFMWNNLKPVYAFAHIGSDAFTEVFNNVRAGEDVWALDVTEAREFYLDKSKKHSYNSWDFKKRFTFQSTSGMNFSLDLEQIMSLYAYSKRDQAAEHLKKGGIVIDETTEITIKNKLGIPVKFNPTEATAYNISDETLADIISKLTDEQKGFVDEMQDYLSTVMGAKGNEVSLEMYGVKLFKEKFYFPLKSAHQFMAKAKEQQKGEVKIKNSGFSKETVQKASNPIVLTPFMNVWADHVNEMSMYHAFVLPMEDFYRVYNYRTPTSDTMATESVEMFIQNAYGKGATQYIDQLLKDLNGGTTTDPRAAIPNKWIGRFKKGAVFASMSVVVQQPSAIARAAALLDIKHFIGPRVDRKRHKVLWDEVKQYAPVAIIKEMGYFDTNMGKSTQDFILGKEYSGFGEKMKALVTDSGYRDEILSKAPALADEIAWCGIWEAVKRETKAKNPGMDVKSEAFLKKAGDRFTEVIVKTQVYDSVLSRSGLMRSKDTLMKMATAFMAEPTTSINMIADALLQGKRGNGKYAGAAIGSVIASQILNSILVSFVYAGRDDDEDKTYWEKYIGTLSGEVLDGLNPATYIPFIKDIVSIVQGYDVERSDMAVISDLWKAWGNLKKEDVSVYRKVEGFAGSVAQIFGLPVKNIMRDARGIYQTVMSFMNGQQTTKAGIVNAVKETLPAWLGGGATSNQQQLYEAILSGDKEQLARVQGRYADQTAINSAIRKALRENDSRIRAAAEAKVNGDLDEYMRLAREIIKEGYFSQDNVVAAINAEINAMSKEETSTSATKESGMFKTDDFALAIAQGDTAMANAIKQDIIQTAQKNGKTAEEAEKSFSSSASGACKEMFMDGKITEKQAINALVVYCGLEQEDAEKRVGEWAFEDEYGFIWSDRGDAYKSGEISKSELKAILMDVGGKTEDEAELQIQVYDWEKEVPGCDDITMAAIRDYNENCANVGISKATYYEVWTNYKNTDADYYPDGDSIPNSKAKKVMQYINSLNLTSAQKTALAMCWWAASTVNKYKPW